MAIDSGIRSPAMLYERNDAWVVVAFRKGEFDYLEAVGGIPEADFFRAIASRKILEKLAATYPSPAKKHEVPVWVYIASDLAMRFHGEHHFAAYPYVVRAGGLIEAFGPRMGRKVTHPETGDVSLACEGFNHKNDYDRETPCDQDYLRKMARRTDAGLLQDWYNREVVGIFKQHRAFDGEGIFIGDGTYLFVPENDRYEGSSVLLFDEHHHPVESQTLTPQQRKRCRWRRCYKLVSLLHTNRAGEYFVYASLAVVPGKDHECPVLYDLLEQFVGTHGRGVIKRLIVDRGFIDGPSMGRCKKEWGIDVLIPARSNMLRERVALLAGLEESGLEHVLEERLRLSPGAERLIARCRELGLRTLLVSGGFSFFTDWLRTRLGIDEALSNELEIADGRLTGRVIGEIVDGEAKAARLLRTMRSIGASREQTIAVGDGANDLPMMAEAGVSVAYRAKPIVREHAMHAIEHAGLDGVLNLFL